MPSVKSINQSKFDIPGHLFQDSICFSFLACTLTQATAQTLSIEITWSCSKICYIIIPKQVINQNETMIH